MPRTFEAWAAHLLHTPADAVFILGDLFEVWVGDDARSLPFEQALRRHAGRRPRRPPARGLHGGQPRLPARPRDAARPAADGPARPDAAGAPGASACCSAMATRCAWTTCRVPAFRAGAQRGLAGRVPGAAAGRARAIGAEMRRQSQRRRTATPSSCGPMSTPPPPCLDARAWAAAEMVHGHTHRPGSAALAPGFKRHVLSDWDLDHAAPRAERAAPARDGFAAPGRRRRPDGRLGCWGPGRKRWQRGASRRACQRRADPRRPVEAHAGALPLPAPARPGRRCSELRRLTSLFLDRKEFTAAGGLRLTDDDGGGHRRAGLPAGAALGLERYDGFVGIVVHPDQVVARREVADDDGVVHAYDEVLAGEAMQGGPVMLSWRDVRAAGSSAAPGLQRRDPRVRARAGHGRRLADGMPPLPPDLPAAEWQACCSAEYDGLRASGGRRARTRRSTPTAPVPDEFFAVASEAFFVTPRP
jgi:MtfA peptidase